MRKKLSRKDLRLIDLINIYNMFSLTLNHKEFGLMKLCSLQEGSYSSRATVSRISSITAFDLASRRGVCPMLFLAFALALLESSSLTMSDDPPAPRRGAAYSPKVEGTRHFSP